MKSDKEEELTFYMMPKQTIHFQTTFSFSNVENSDVWLSSEELEYAKGESDAG